MGWSASCEKGGNTKITIRKANITASKLIRKDSVRNCLISCPFWEPNTFRNPTSLERSMDFAVARLM